MKKSHDSLPEEAVEETVSRIRKERIHFESETRLGILDIENKWALSLLLSVISVFMAAVAMIMIIATM